MTGRICPLAARAESQPNDVAISFPDGALTFEQLDAYVVRLVTGLREDGVQRGSRIAFVATRRWQDIALFWALWRLRAIACPISPRFPQRRQQELVDQIRATCLLDPIAVDAWLADGRSQHLHPCSRDVEADLAATILFSSGTTNAPKAVVHALAAHIESARGSATNIPLEPGDRWLASLPFHHVSGLAILIRAMLAGAAVVLPNEGSPLVESIRSQRATHCSVVASQLRQLVDAGAAELATLKCVLLGGGPCSHEFIRQAITNRLPLRTTYGLTEMASQVTATPEGCNMDRITTAGPVLPGRELRIEHGEILVRGLTLCLGYDRNGAIETMVDDNGWFHTGDAGSLGGDGFLTVTGRLDQMFISGGENIHPEAIEQHLLALPGIRHAIVVPIDDRAYGQRPVAFVDAAAFAPEAWEQAIREVLPSYMIPDAWLPWPNDVETDRKVPRHVLKERARAIRLG